MSASIKLQLSTTDCLQFAEAASHIFQNCQAASYNNVKQLFTRSTPPPSQIILRANFYNHDIFEFPFLESVPVVWKVKLKTVTDNGAVKHTHYASFNPSRLKLGNAQITDFHQIKWDIDLVEYTTSYGTDPVVTTMVNIRTMIFNESLSMIHPTPHNPFYESRSCAAIFDYCFQPQRNQTGVLETTFRPQNNTILALKPTDVQQLPLTPLDPQVRLDLLSALHKPPERRRSPPRHGSQYRDSREPSSQPSAFPGSQSGQSQQPYPPDLGRQSRTSRSQTPYDRGPDAPPHHQRRGSAHSPVTSGAGPSQPDPAPPGPGTNINTRGQSQEPPPLSTVQGPAPEAPPVAPQGPPVAPQQPPLGSQQGPPAPCQPQHGAAQQPFQPADPTAGLGDAVQNVGVSSGNASQAVQTGPRVTFGPLVRDLVRQQIHTFFNNNPVPNVNVPSVGDSDIPVTNSNYQSSTSSVPNLTVPGVSEMNPHNQQNNANNTWPGQSVWLHQPPYLSQGQGYGRAQQHQQQPGQAGQQQQAPGNQNWAPQNLQQPPLASVRMPGHYGPGPGDQQSQRQQALPPLFQGYGSVSNPPPPFQNNGGANNLPPPFQGNGGGGLPPPQINGGVNNLPPPFQGNGGGGLPPPQNNVEIINQVNNANDEAFRAVNSRMRQLHSNSPHSPGSDYQDNISDNSNDNVGNKNKKKHRAGNKKQAKKLALASGNLLSPGSNDQSLNGSYVPAGGRIVDAGLQQMQASLAQQIQPRPESGSQSVPSALELPPHVISGLVNMENPNIARIHHLLQGQVPPDMLNRAVELNVDIVQILAKTRDLQAQVARKSINVQGVTQFHREMQDQLNRINDAVSNGNLGLNFSNYATEACRNACEAVKVCINAARTQQELEWSMGDLNESHRPLDSSTPQRPHGSAPQTGQAAALPNTMGSQPLGMGAATPGTMLSTPARQEDFMTPGDSSHVLASPQTGGPPPSAPRSASAGGQGQTGPPGATGPAQSGGNFGPAPPAPQDETALGVADFNESTAPQQINQMNINEVRFHLAGQERAASQSTSQRTRAFYEVSRQALQARLNFLEEEERSRVAREQQEMAQRNLAAGLNADGTPKTPANNHVAETVAAFSKSPPKHLTDTIAEFSRTSQASVDVTDPIVVRQGPGVSFQQQRQIAFATGSASGTPAATSTPMEVSTQQTGPSLGQEISDVQNRAAQVDLSNSGEANTQAAPVVQAPGGVPSDAAGAGAGAPSAPHAPSAPEQGAMGGGDYQPQPFDNAIRSASYINGQSTYSPYVASNFNSGNNSGLVNSVNNRNEPNMSRNLQCSHPNISRLNIESMKQEIQSANRSRRLLTPGLASPAASSSTQQGIGESP